MTQQIDIGDRHTLTFCTYEGEISGCSIAHPRPDNGLPCDGFVAFEGRAWARSFQGGITTWKVLQDDPLTLSPSVLCRGCGDHGHVINGRWVKT